MKTAPSIVVTSSQRAMRAAGWTLGGFLSPVNLSQDHLLSLRARLILAGALEVAFSHCGFPGPVAYWAKWPPIRNFMNVVNN